MFGHSFRPLGLAASVFAVIVLVGTLASWRLAVHHTDQTSREISHELLRASDQIDLLVARLQLATTSLAREVDLQAGTLGNSAIDIATVDGFRTALLLSADGIVLDDTREGQPALGLDVSDRAYFKGHATPGSGFLLDAPVNSRIDGQWSLPSTAAIRSASGDLQAVAIISVGFEYFQSASAIIDSVGAMAFIGRNGQDAFFPLTGRQDHTLPVGLASRVNTAAFEHNGSLEPIQTDQGHLHVFNSPTGDFDLAVFLPNEAIKGAFLNIIASYMSVTVIAAAIAAVLSAIFASSWLAFREQVDQTTSMEERLRLATNAADIGVWEMDLADSSLTWDSTMHDLYGVAPSEFHGRFIDWRDRIHPDDVDDAETEYNRCIESGDTFDRQFRVIANEEVRHIQANAKVLRDHDGSRTRMIGANFDVTDRVVREQQLVEARHSAEEARAQIEKIAVQDALTGLLNRRGLQNAITQGNPDGGPVALILFDLDRFKMVNDSFGHQAGDAVLKAIADRLRKLSKPDDVMARIGGDEFVVMRKIADAQETEEWAQDVILTLSEPVEHDGYLCRFGVSGGAAHGTVTALRSGGLIQNADYALYQSKKDGRGSFRYFTEEMEQSLSNRKAIAHDLETAINRNEFSLVYMPKYEVKTRQLIGLEALLRWDNHRQGRLSPGSFLAIADDLKLTSQIDAHVLKLVVLDRSAWQKRGLVPPTISVNVSTRRLSDPRLIDSVLSRELPKGSISFELLESVFLDDVPADISENLDLLRANGIGIEIDDFGSGHASILAVPKIAPDFIKIDRVLIENIDRSAAARQTMKSIIDMVSCHGARVIAEGVERYSQLEVLDGLGCYAAQGYLFGKPVTSREALDVIKQRAAA